MNDNRTYAERMAEEYKDPLKQPEGFRFSMDIVDFSNVSDPTVIKINEPLAMMVSSKEQEWVDNTRKSYYQRQIDARHIQR